MNDGEPLERSLICFVDDELAILSAYSAALRSRGDFDVETFNRAASFLAFDRAETTRCLVADYKMPQMDGRQLLIEVRRRGWTFSVIVSSGFAETEIRPRFAGLNVAAFIEKSAGAATLMTTIVKQLRPLI